MLSVLNSSRSLLMLRVEWPLLVMTALTTIVLGSIDISPRFPIVAIVCILALGLIGLKLPKNQLFCQIIYILVEFTLAWLPIFSGDRIPTFVLLMGVIIIRNYEIFKGFASFITTGSTMLLFILTGLVLREDSFTGFFGRVVGQVQSPHDIEYSIRNILILKLCTLLYFIMLSVFFLMLINSLLSERQSRDDLSVALARIRLYALQIENKAALQERNRIAREIHDALGHTLTAQSIQLDSGLLLLNSAAVEEANSFFKTAKELCTQALQEVRQSVTTLRGDSLPLQTLETSITSLIEKFQSTTNILLNCTISLSEPIPSEISSAIYRIVQEALTNITRHSTATEVKIELVTRDKTLYIIVKDNGKGFNPQENSTGFGIQGMEERTTILDGQFNLVSQPGMGCLITAQIPLLRLL